MCYNCGCNMPDNPMGKGHAGAEPTGKNITNKTFIEAGIVMQETDADGKNNALDLLKKVLGEKPYRIVKDPSGFDRYDDVPEESRPHGPDAAHHEHHGHDHHDHGPHHDHEH